MQNFYSDISNLKFFVIGGIIAIESCFCIWTKNNSCSSFFSQINMSRYKICMYMSFKNKFDLSTIFLRSLNIGLRFSKGVNNRCFAVRLNIICALGKTIGVDLFDNHDVIILYKFKFFEFEQKFFYVKN